MFFSRLSTAQSLFILISVSLLIKVAMALILPITGDEAYFIVWGKHLDYGFYDHPPMVGWWLTALLQFSDHPLWLRLPTILGTLLIGWIIYRLVLPRGKSNAVIAAGLYWLAPVHLLAPLITTDTPLIIWSFLSAVAFYKAQRHDRFGWYFTAGVLLGLAFYSKFFAGLLGVAYFLYLLVFVRRGLRPWLGLAVLVLGVLPFIALNLYWNYQHCWDNYLFNLQNRTSDFEWSLWKPVQYLLLLVYLVTPPVVFYVMRKPGEAVEVMRNGGLGLFLALFVIPIVLFVFLSVGKNVGLHWLLSFYPFLFIALALLLHFGQLRVCFYFMWGFALLHVLAFAVLWALTPGVFHKYEKTYKSLVYTLYTGELLEQIEPHTYDFPLATPSYSQSSILAYHTREDVMVFGPGSYHGRQDDMLTDFRRLDQKGIAIVSQTGDVQKYAGYFDNFTHMVIPFRDTEYHLGIGIGFDYAKYNSEILEPIRLQYYRIPDWLPVGECYMYSRQE